VTKDDFQPISRPEGLDRWSLPPEPLDWYEAVVDDVGVSRLIPHVNNAEYVRWIGTIAVLAGIRAGSTPERLEQENVLWFVARHEIDYRGETFPGDRIVAATWLSDPDRISVIRHTVIGRPNDGRLLITARTRWVLVDGDSRRPTRIPADLLENIGGPTA